MAQDESRSTVLVALAANLVIAVAKLAGGLLAGSAAMLSEAAHSLADTGNEIFLLVSLRRSARPADLTHPFGYGKERYVWSMLAAVGIFVSGACFSAYEGLTTVFGAAHEEKGFYPLLYTVLAVSFVAEGSSLLKALLQLIRSARTHGRSPLRMLRETNDTTLSAVVAEDSAAVGGLVLAAAGLVLHQLTRSARWEGVASLLIAALLGFVAFQLGRRNMDLLIGQSASVELRLKAWDYLAQAAGVDAVLEVQTMQLAPHSVLLAARLDLNPGMDSERVEVIAGTLRTGLADLLPTVDAAQIYLDVSDATAASRHSAHKVHHELRTATAQRAAE